jgi:VanZ family protein
VYVAYIFFSGTSRQATLPGRVSDKTAHFVAFGLMVPLGVLALRYLSPRLGLVRCIAIGVLVASGLGALLEFVQSFLPYRSCDVWDWVADTIGALFAAVIVAALGFAIGQRRAGSRST